MREYSVYLAIQVNETGKYHQLLKAQAYFRDTPDDTFCFNLSTVLDLLMLVPVVKLRRDVMRIEVSKDGYSWDAALFIDWIPSGKEIPAWIKN